METPHPDPRRGLFARWAEWLVRAMARQVGDARAVLAVVLAAGLVLIVSGSLLFAWIAREVAEGEMDAFDRAILQWMKAHRSPQLTDFALNVTALGSGVIIPLVVLVGASFLWASRHRWSAALLVVSVLSAWLANRTLKGHYDRPRPELFEWGAPYAGESSFPSGHSMTAMVAYATLAYLVARLERKQILRVMTAILAVILIVAVGVSRVYLGVHYPSDVLAGFAAGAVWAVFCAVSLEALRLLRMQKPEVAQQERGVEAGAAPAAERPE